MPAKNATRLYGVAVGSTVALFFVRFLERILGDDAEETKWYRVAVLVFKLASQHGIARSVLDVSDGIVLDLIGCVSGTKKDHGSSPWNSPCAISTFHALNEGIVVQYVSRSQTKHR